MRIHGVSELLLCAPLACACVAGFVRVLPQTRDGAHLAVVSLIVVAVTAGAGLLARSDLCAYLAGLINVLFFIGCVILLCYALSDLGDPLPPQRSNTDDAPELTALGRNVAVALSFASLLASTFLLWLSFIVIRATAARHT